jgi:hypothetical protein
VASPSGPPAVGSLVLRHVVLLSVLPCCRGCAPPGSPAHPPAGDTAGTKVLPRRLRQLANEAVVTEDGPHPAAKARANSAGVPASSSPAVPLACHSRRSRPVLSGQPRTTPRRLHLHRSLPTQVTTLPDLALQAGSRLVKALIGLAVPGRPIQSLVAGGPERQRRPRPDGTGASRARGGPGPCWVRTVSGTAGPRRARGVTAGMRESQVTGHSCLQPRRVRRGGAGFEPLLRHPFPLLAIEGGRRWGVGGLGRRGRRGWCWLGSWLGGLGGWRPGRWRGRGWCR